MALSSKSSVPVLFHPQVPIMLPQQIHSDIGELLSQKRSDQKVRNREMFMKILRNLCYLAQQGLALRGSHGDDTENNFC